LHDDVLQPGALDRAKTAAVDDLDAAQTFFQGVRYEIVKFFLCFGNNAP
jgi:hypothetical protein